MKKFITFLIGMALCVGTCSLAVACGSGGNSASGGDSSEQSPSVSSVDPSTCEHVFGEWEVFQEAKCEEKGEQRRTCKIGCGAYESRETDALGHDWLEISARKDSTCTKKGTEAVYTCINGCGGTKGGEEIPVKGHMWAWTEEQAKSCTEAGWIAHWACEDCSALATGESGAQTVVTRSEIEIPASHELETVPAQEATCQQIGWAEYERCTVDGCGYFETREIAAWEHEWTLAEERTDATCTEDGKEASYTCEKCHGAKGGEVIPAHHVWKYVEAKAKTCIEAGWLAHWSCDNCDAYATGEDGAQIVTAWTEIEIPVGADGHTWKWVEAKDKSCTESGWIAHWVCENCETYATGEENDKTVTAWSEIEISPHTLETVSAQEATCQQIGWNEYVRCTAEGCGYTTYKEIKKTGHHFVEGTCKDCQISYDDALAAVKINVATIAMNTTSETDLVTDVKPASNATSVTVQFTIVSMAKDNAAGRSPWMRAGAVNGRSKSWQFYMGTAVKDGITFANGLVDYGYYRNAWWSYFREGYVHTYVFDFEKNIYTLSVTNKDGSNAFYNDGATDADGNKYALPWEMTRVYDNPWNQYFGIKMFIENAAADAWNAVFEFKCWDSTGQDLGLKVRSTKNTVTIEEKAPECEHVFGEWETVTAATCETAGEEKRSCTAEGCGYLETREIPATGHIYEEGVCKACGASKPDIEPESTE